jgi:hypothetical protein
LCFSQKITQFLHFIYPWHISMSYTSFSHCRISRDVLFPSSTFLS